jgi:protein involved in polysaccharide export with SLBB domain
MMFEREFSGSIRQRGVHLLLATALIIPGPAFAQIAGYPVDPAEQGRTTRSRQTTGDSTSTTTSTRSGENAAATQTYVPREYEPDELEGTPRIDATGRRVLTEEEFLTDRDREYATRSPRRQAPPSEFEAYVSKMVGKPLRRFGASLLIPNARDFTAPPTTTVPPDYRLNPGDELLVGLTGSVQASNLQLTISSEGQVFIPRVGAVSVAGVRYGDVQDVIARAVSRQYRNFRVAVSVGRLHGITVYVTGFAATPGSYTVSSLSTLVNAVLAAGGPSAGGSFRSIQVRRNGQLISDFDLYDLLLKGDKRADVVLQNGDVIYIAPAGAQVAVIGSVNVEAIYEARADEKLYDMLLYAGGVNTVADDTRLLVFNAVNPKGWQELAPSQVEQRTAQRGEVVRVLSAVGIAQPQFKQPALVTVSGEVARPGRYYVQPGTPLSAVIERAGGLTAQAYPYGAVFTRETVRQTQTDSYERAIKDLELTLSAQPLVRYETQEFQPARLEAVRSVVDQLEARKPDGRLVLSLLPADRTLPSDMIVENNDTIYVPHQPITVGVFGAVPSPASFQYRQGESIGDYLRRAGGIRKFGDKGGIFVIRANGSLIAQKGGFFGGSVLGAPALPGDLIFVPVDANQGEFWARLRDISTALAPAIVTGAALAK